MIQTQCYRQLQKVSASGQTVSLSGYNVPLTLHTAVTMSALHATYMPYMCHLFLARSYASAEYWT